MSASLCDAVRSACFSQIITPPSPHSLTAQQNHLRSEHGADLGEQHVTGQSEQDVRFEGGEPHHPLRISRVLCTHANTWQLGPVWAPFDER